MTSDSPLLQPNRAHPLVVNFHGWNPVTQGDTPLPNGSFSIGVSVPSGWDRGGMVYTTLSDITQLPTLAQELVDDPITALANWFSWHPKAAKPKVKAKPVFAPISLDDLEL